MARSTDIQDSRVVSPGLEATSVRRATAPAFPAARGTTAWGPIWGGTVSAASLFILMEMFTIWVGWVTIRTGAGGIAGTGREWITWIVACIAFFLGGLIATLASPMRGMIATALNGFLVWALTTSIMIAASFMGAGLALGAIGGSIARILLVTPGHAVGGANLGAFASGAQTAGFWAFITLITTAVAAIIGAWLGGASDPIGYIDERRTIMQD